MSGESAQDIEVSITAPNRSFHATVIASDVSWQDRGGSSADHLQQSRRPIWSSAFGNSTDSESYDPMINSATSLSQDSYDGMAVEFISSKDTTSYMNGGVANGTGFGAGEVAGIAAEPVEAAAACVAATAASDTVTASIEARRTATAGFAENERGSISCEMMTASPVLVANGNLLSGTPPVTVAPSIDTTTTTTVTVESEVTTHAPLAFGSTFQISPMNAHDEEHAEAPDRPRDRAMSLHERSLLAHEMHSVSSTMETIRDEEEEIPVGSSSLSDGKQTEPDSISFDRRASMTGVPISATSFVANSQPTIFEGAEPASDSPAAAAAPATDAAATAAESVAAATAEPLAATAAEPVAAAAAEPVAAAAAEPVAAAAAVETSPYLRRLLDSQEQTRQLMELLGESTQILGAVSTSQPEAGTQSDLQQSSVSENATAEISSAVTVTSQSSSTMTLSSTVTGSTLTPSNVDVEPSSPLFTISSRPIDITFDDGTTVGPGGTAAEVTPSADSSTTVTQSTPPEELITKPVEVILASTDVTKITDSSTTVTESSSSTTQNESICNALSGLQAAMTTVTTTSTLDTIPPPSPTVTTEAPKLLDTTVLLQAHSVYSPAPVASPAPFGGTPEPDTATLLHDATVSLLAAATASTAEVPPTPNEQEVFITSAIENEKEVIKSSVIEELPASDLAATAAVATSTTDYVIPCTSVVLTAEEPTDAAAVSSVPVTTSAAVDVPVELVRHLDDPSAWHSAPISQENDNAVHAVPIALVDAVATAPVEIAQGPPLLAHEPPSSTTPPAHPPPLARESDSASHHDFSRSVMVERRVLSPDSAAAAQVTDADIPTAADHPATTEVVREPLQMPQSPTISATSVDVPVAVFLPTETSATQESVIQALNVQQDQDSAPLAPSAHTEINAAIDVSQELPQEPAAATDSVDIPVSICQQLDANQATDAGVTHTSDESPASIQVPTAQQTSEEPGTQSVREAPSADAATSAEIPASVPMEAATVKQSDEVPIATAAAGTPVDIPISVFQQPEEQAPVITQSESTTLTTEQLSQEPMVTIQETSAADSSTVETATVQAHPVSTVPEPIATSETQEPHQPSATASSDAAELTTPTTSLAPLSLESTFQISPSDDDAAHPPAMLRDRAMSIHEKSLLAHEHSGFQRGLESLPESPKDDEEVHVASAGDEISRRASLAPGDSAPTASFQLPSTSCLFTVDEGTGTAPDDSETAPASTASPSNESASMTIPSSAGDTPTDKQTAVIDITAPSTTTVTEPPSLRGVQWLTESEACTVGGAPPSHEKTPDSPATIVAATETLPQTPKTPSGVTFISENAPEHATEAPVTPKTPSGVSWITEQTRAIADTAATAPSQESQAAKKSSDFDRQIQSDVSLPADVTTTPAIPTGTSCITEQSASIPSHSPGEPAPAAVDQSPSLSSVNLVQEAPQTPKIPAGVSSITEEPASIEPLTQGEPAPVVDQSTTLTGANLVAESPQTPKTPTGVSSISEEPASIAPQTQGEPAPVVDQSTTLTGANLVAESPLTPKTPTGISWITEPAVPIQNDGASSIQPMLDTNQQIDEEFPTTPKTPSGVSWITEVPQSGRSDATVATPAPISVINITAPLESEAGAAGPPRTPTSPGIQWSGESTMTGGNVPAAGGAPAPAESTFLINAPWSGGAAPPSAPVPTPDADGVTWITEKPSSPKDSLAESVPRPPLTRTESTRSDRDASTATDITVRATSPTRVTLGQGISAEEDLASGVMQESQGTKVRKLSWADQQQNSTAEDSFNIDDYEKKLNETTAQTKDLVNLLCQTGAQLSENTMKMSDAFSDAVQASVRSMLDQEKRDRQTAVLSPIAENGEVFNREPPPQLIAGALPPNVESVIVSSPELKFVSGSLVLANANILVTDEEAGLFLFTLDSKVVRHVTNPNWKRPASPVIFKDRLKSYILVLMDCKDEEDGAWVRHVVKFSENLDYMEKVECPVWIREKTVVSDRLAVNRYENIYYCANGEIFSGLYELAPTGRWTELLYRQSESFIDMLAFSIIGPIQQILIVEGRRDHVLLCSIRESQCVEAKRMAVCERPGALAKDECGRLFVMNRAQAAIQIVDTRFWASCRNMTMVDKFVPHFSAAFGMLAIPQRRAVKVHKYSFEWDD